MLWRRLCSQWLQLQSLLLTVLGVTGDSALGPAGLVRDDFGLHKLILAVTKSGKVGSFLLDQWSPAFSHR